MSNYCIIESVSRIRLYKDFNENYGLADCKMRAEFSKILRRFETILNLVML